MPGAEMLGRFYRDASEQNRDLFERIKYLHSGKMTRESHFVAFTQDRRVIGDLDIQQSPYDGNVIWLKHVSVDGDFRRQGIAGRLLSSLHASRHG
jgi:hypothetical protein